MPSTPRGWDRPVRWPRPTLVRVRGASMEPTLRDGDVVLMIRGGRPRPGAMAVVRLPRDRHGIPRPLSIKRLTGTDPDDPTRWWIDSDNPREGVTSFDVGSLAKTDVLAVQPRWSRRGKLGTPTPGSKESS